MKFGTYLSPKNEIWILTSTDVWYGSSLHYCGYSKHLYYYPKSRRHKHVDLSGITRKFEGTKLVSNNDKITKMFIEVLRNRDFCGIFSERVRLDNDANHLINIVKIWHRLYHRGLRDWRGIRDNNDLMNFMWRLDQENIQRGGKSHW